MIQQNRVKQALHYLKQREESLFEELTDDAALVNWNKEKLWEMNKIVMLYDKKLSQEEKDTLLVLKAHRNKLKKILYPNRLSRIIRSAANEILKPFVKRQHAQLQRANAVAIGNQFRQMGITISDYRLAHYISVGATEAIIPFNKWLSGSDKMDLEYVVNKDQHGRARITGVKAELSREGSPKQQQVYMDFEECGKLDIGQVRSLLYGKPIVNKVASVNERAAAQWLQLGYENGSSIIKKIPFDNQVQKELSSLPLSPQMKIDEVMQLLKRGLTTDVLLKNGEYVFITAAPFKPEQIGITDKSGSILDKEACKTMGKQTPIYSMYNYPGISAALQKTSSNVKTQDNNLSIS